MKIFFAVLILFFISQPVLGHKLGQSLEKEVNGYIVDVGYDAVDKIESGEATRFDFNLWNQDKSKVIDFDHIWLRIAPGDKGILFGGYLYRPEYLLTGMSYAFPRAGQYILTVRFIDKDDKAMAEATFPLDVIEGESGQFGLFRQLSFGFMGLALGFGGALFVKAVKRRGVDKS